MSSDPVAEVLAVHADELNSGKTVETAQFLEAYPERAKELVPLLDLAVQLKRTLKPVQAPPAFRARLHDGLLMAAHHQATHRILVDQQEEVQWGWLLGAAALGSAAGLIAFVLRSRAQSCRAVMQARAECEEQPTERTPLPS
jgi:hypothetical protein